MGDLEEGEGERETARKIGRVTCHGALNGKGITACSYGHFVAGLGIGPSREAPADKPYEPMHMPYAHAHEKYGLRPSCPSGLGIRIS